MEVNIKEGNFVAFRNTKLKDSHPDYKGEIVINGERKQIVVWIKRDKNDDQFLSGSVNEKKVDEIQTGREDYGY